MTLSSNSLKAMLTQLPTDQHALFIERFQTQSPALLERLQALYGNAENFSAWLDQLMVSVAKVAAARPAALRELDQQRQQDKDWFGSQEMLGYCSYVDHFAGDLNGVIEKIPHLTEMGVRYLHLLPFLRARVGENDGGFAVSSFSEIEPRFGNMADLRKLTVQLRQENISLCSDFILNHVADDHPWALAAKAGESRYRDYFYCYQDRAEPDKFEQTLGQVFPQAAPGNFSYIDSLQRWVWTTFYPYQWDLNYTNPAVFAEMALALLSLANQGIEVFRLDSTAFLWKREGSNCMNQPEAHWILQALRCIVDIAAPGVLLKAEAIVATAELPAYLGSKDAEIKECHLAYHSSLMAAGWAALAEQDTAMIKAVMQATPNLPEQTSWLTYVRCHDDIGWNVLRAEAQADGQDAQQRLAKVSRFFTGEGDSFARGASFQAADPSAVHGSVGMASALCGYPSAHNETEIILAQRRMLLLYGLALTFGGLPVIYMGDELAQGNDNSYRDFPAKAKDSRWLQRPDLDQKAYAQKHQAHTEAGQIFTDLCHMFSCRRNSPQLATSQQRHMIHCDQPELFVFARGDLAGHDALTFVGNFSERAVTLDLRTLHTLNDQVWFDVLIDVLTEQTYHIGVAQMLVVPPYGQFWLRHSARRVSMKQPNISSIVVFGEALADEFPEQKIIGGAPFNVARTLAHFGCAPLMISRIGQDEVGALIQSNMQSCGMSAIGMQVDATRPSGRVVVTQNNPEDNSSHQFEILPDQAYDYIELATAQQAITSYYQNQPVGLIYFGTLAQRSLTSRQSLSALLKEEKTLKYLDLNLRDGQANASTIDDSLCRADIVKLNEDELCYLLDQYSGNACTTLDLDADRLSWKPAIDGLMKQFDLLAIIVTLGARGYAYFDVEGEFFSADQMPTPTNIVDTVGGGDAFSAVFLTGLYQGWPLAISLRRAHEFATAVCGIRGAVSSDAQFYQNWLQQWEAEEQIEENAT